ncbi:MAG: hypothetical protein KAI53_02420 [Candidatus Aenigmarchaeota archaeon]|nr:hypothetical protein [Candidatus Aenigmarchaeota archaeon]
MDAIIKTTTRLLVPLIMVFGFYVSLHGHISPGGGFPGGVILASAFLLLVIAFTEKEVEKHFSEIKIGDLKSVASIALLGIVLLEVIVRPDILHLQTPLTLWSGGVTIFLNLFGAIVVASGLVIIVYSLVKEEWKSKKSKW